MLRAFTRSLSPLIADCELTYIDRTAIDFDLAVRQHAAYEDALRSLRVTVTRLPGDGFADGVFIEDTAVVLDEVAIICRPGAESRRTETAAVAEALTPFRRLYRSFRRRRSKAAMCSVTDANFMLGAPCAPTTRVSGNFATCSNLRIQRVRRGSPRLPASENGVQLFHQQVGDGESGMGET